MSSEERTSWISCSLEKTASVEAGGVWWCVVVCGGNGNGDGGWFWIWVE